ncbi:MAG: S8 family serine peptidase [Planctomycetota bacterium]
MHLRPPLALVAIAIAALSMTSVAFTQNDLTIAWRSGGSPSDPTARDGGNDDAALRRGLVELAADPQTRHVVVGLRATPTASQRRGLASAGLYLTTPLGSRYFFARLETTANVVALVDSALLQAVARIQGAWKLHPLWQQGAPSYALLPGNANDPVVAAHVVLHRGVAPVTARARIAAHGGTWLQPLRTIPGGIVHLPLRSLEALAQEDVVQWIEPPLPPLTASNDSNRTLTQADIAQALPYDVDGSGVTVMVFDGGTADTSHPDFGARATARDNSGTIEHATHVAGTIGGDGTASSGQFRGMAPGVTIESFGLEVAPGSGIFLYANPADLEGDYDAAINQFGAVLSNNSIGTNVALNGFPCSLLGDYGVASSLIDGIVGGSLGPPMRIVWSAGNERSQMACGNMFDQISPPSGAKNSIVVGAVNSNDDSMTGFSGWGPTNDGRVRPDVVTTGCEVGSDGGVTSCAPGGGYSTQCGTSMSAPTATGLAALLLEHIRLLHPNAPDPLNSTLKALLTHTANDGGNIGPDYQYGYGSLRVADALDLATADNFFEGSVSHGGNWDFTVTVAPGDTELKVTLVWDDYPGAPNVTNTLVNDLDLVVTDPSGAQSWPWTLDPANPSNPAIQSTADHVNNIEQVLVANPIAGAWQVSIVGFDVPEGAQSFSVAVTPEVQTVVLDMVTPLPTLITPQQPTNLTVRLRGVNDTIVAGSEMLHYRFDGGAFLTAPLAPVGGDEFTATIPGTNCATTPELYFSATGTASGTATLPRSAPTDVFTTSVGELITTFADDFELDQGWTVGATDDTATTGLWERVDPNGTGAQPEDDHTAAGIRCFVTGQGSPGGTLGENDVDNGKTTLFSPTFDLAGLDPFVSYWRWYSNDTGSAPNADVFTVDVSVDGQNWINVETVGPTGPGTSGGWLFHEFRLSDFVTPTATIQFRFVAEDAPGGSLVEAAVDDFRIQGLDCVGGDCNGNGTPDADDIAAGTSADLDLNQVPDECECSTPLFIRGDANRDFSLNISDATALLSYMFLSTAAPLPLAAGDTNDDGSINLQDPLVLLDYLFGGAASPLPAPFPDIGCGD